MLGPMCSVNGGGESPAVFVDVHVLVACVCCAVCGSELFAWLLVVTPGVGGVSGKWWTDSCISVLDICVSVACRLLSC